MTATPHEPAVSARGEAALVGYSAQSLTPSLRTPDFSVVIPFYNEAENLSSLLHEVLEVMNGQPGTWEGVLVSDGSTDGTAAALRELATRHACLRPLCLGVNRGQAAALYTGLLAARGRRIITMDGDGQNVPADIPDLLKAMHDTNADMVVGIRQGRQDSRLRLIMSRLANRVRGRILRDGVSDSGCALKVIRSDALQALLPIRTLYSFMPAMVASAGFKVVQIPVRHRARSGGCSGYGLRVFLWRPVVDMLGMWWFTHRCLPLKGMQEDSRVSAP